MAIVGIMGGTGAALFPVAAETELSHPDTEWGPPSAPLLCWQQDNHDVVFLSRHGPTGNIPPHLVNYRANIASMAASGVDYLISLNAVGGIATGVRPGTLVLPDQLIDYTWGRAHTRYEGERLTEYIDITEPYDSLLRGFLIKAAAAAELELTPSGTYGVTQGPRLETRAEIDRLERDGCTLVGMTGMPEASLAREYGLRYASCCMVVNVAAGRSNTAIHAEIDRYLAESMQSAASLLGQLLKSL